MEVRERTDDSLAAKNIAIHIDDRFSIYREEWGSTLDSIYSMSCLEYLR